MVIRHWGEKKHLETRLTPSHTAGSEFHPPKRIQQFCSVPCEGQMRGYDLWDVDRTKTSGISSGTGHLILKRLGAEILALLVAMEPGRETL